MPQGRAQNQGTAFRQFLAFLQSSGQFNRAQALRVFEIENRNKLIANQQRSSSIANLSRQLNAISRQRTANEAALERQELVNENRLTVEDLRLEAQQQRDFGLDERAAARERGFNERAAFTQQGLDAREIFRQQEQSSRSELTQQGLDERNFEDQLEDFIVRSSERRAERMKQEGTVPEFLPEEKDERTRLQGEMSTVLADDRLSTRQKVEALRELELKMSQILPHGEVPKPPTVSDQIEAGGLGTHPDLPGVYFGVSRNGEIREVHDSNKEQKPDPAIETQRKAAEARQKEDDKLFETLRREAASDDNNVSGEVSVDAVMKVRQQRDQFRNISRLLDAGVPEDAIKRATPRRMKLLLKLLDEGTDLREFFNRLNKDVPRTAEASEEVTTTNEEAQQIVDQFNSMTDEEVAQLSPDEREAVQLAIKQLRNQERQ